MTRIQYDPEEGTIFVPDVPGVIYSIEDEPVQGRIVLDGTTKVTATPEKGFRFAEGATSEWTFEGRSDDVNEFDEEPLDE